MTARVQTLGLVVLQLLLTFLAILFLTDVVIQLFSDLGAHKLAAILTFVVFCLRPLGKPSVRRSKADESLIIVGWVIVAALAIENGAISSSGWFQVFGWLIVIAAGAALFHKPMSDPPTFPLP